jgi:hypothetical protein
MIDRRNAVVLFFVTLLGMGLFVNPGYPHDSGQWEETTPAMREWYRSLRMPDSPSISCCGEADAYFAEARVRDGKTYAVIVDDRPDEPRHRPHVPVGTEIEIPNHKLKYDAGNPTGHAVIFLGTGRGVYCFVQGTGI